MWSKPAISRGIPVLVPARWPWERVLGRITAVFLTLINIGSLGLTKEGVGNRLPFGELDNNNSHALVDDVLLIQQHLKIKKMGCYLVVLGVPLWLCWWLFGNLLSVIGLILRGIFLAREQDYTWYLEASGGAAQLVPRILPRAFCTPIKSRPKDGSIHCRCLLPNIQQ